MAQNQNSSFLNHFSYAFGDKTINSGQIHPLHSNFNQNYVNRSGFISSALARSNPTANTIRFRHQSGHILQNTHLGVTGYGQQRFCQSITEVRRTLIASSRLEMADFVDCGFHMQNQSALSPNNIIQVSEVVRNTQFFSSTSTMDRLLSQGDSTPSFHRHSNFGNPKLLALNQTNCPSMENNYSFSSIHHNQNNSIIRETPTTIGLGKNINRQIDIGLALNPTNSVYSSQVQGQSLSPGPNPGPNLNPTFDLPDVKCHRNSYIGEPSRKPISIFTASNNQRTSQTNNNDSNEAVEYDGVTHSLHRKKNGSYICPKCKAVYSTSQNFASHVKSHYRNETPIERRKRLAAKIKKRNKNKFRLFHSRDGLTVVPINN